jgi:hypothetical protein
MPIPKINYAKQRNLQCYQNAQHWYYVNALNNLKNPKNSPAVLHKNKLIVEYYTNGRGIIN